DLVDVEGTMVGFRFPDYGEALEVSGYHLHFITADRSRGGHVLEARPRQATVRLDVSTDPSRRAPTRRRAGERRREPAGPRGPRAGRALRLTRHRPPAAMVPG